MNKILIADSDLDNVRNFKTYLRASFPEIKTVRTLSDPSKGVIDQIETADINLLIADIRFFGLSGYAIIKEIHERFPSVLMLLYGGINDGEYMKQAMDYGVVEYMFRPVKPAEFQRCMQVALAALEEIERKRKEEESLLAECNQRLFSFEMIFLNNLVEGNIQNELEIQRSFRYFQMEFQKGYCVLVLRIDHFKKLLLALDEQEKHLLIYKILKIMQKSLPHKGNRAFIHGFHSVVAVTGGDDLETIMSCCETIREAVFQATKVKVTIGIGRVYEKAVKIGISYKEAQAALRYRFYMGHDTVIPIHFVEPMNYITYRYPIKKEDKLVYAAAIGQYEYCVVLLRDLLDALRESAPLPDKLLSKIIMDILVSINRYASEIGLPIQSHFTTFFPSKEIIELNDIDQAFDYMSNALKNFCAFVVKLQGESNEQLYENTKLYIEERYYESFSLAKIAINLGTTSEYLNRVFYAKAGKNIFDYLLDIRMREAKKLMRETDFDDNLIAVKVGYDDGRHFRSVFRQTEGNSAKEYRNKFSLFSPALQ